MGNNKRVGRIKNFLLFAPYVFILVLIISCIVLVCFTVSQGRRIDELESYLEKSSSEYDSLKTDVNKIDISNNKLARSVGDLSTKVDSIDATVRDIADKIPNENANIWPSKVYLTFDDGPSSNTEQILAILKRYGVKANFFVVGTQNENLKKLYKRIADEGHVIGMHSYSHKYSEIYVSTQAFTDDLDRISDLIYEQTGVRPTIYRFPGGSSNKVSRVPMNELVDILDERGITYYDWNVLSGDATNPMLPTEEIVENSLKDLNQYREAMILFHDLSNKTTTVEALPIIIESLLEQGITIAPIDDTTALIQHNTN